MNIGDSTKGFAGRLRLQSLCIDEPIHAMELFLL
jgi:hypothetical protein